MNTDYQPEPPSNQQWTDGDYYPEIGDTADWNVIPLTEDELYAFKGLLNSIVHNATYPNPSTFEFLLYFQGVTKAYHAAWTSYEI